MHDRRKALPWQERGNALDYWKKQGLKARHANALINAGYTSLDDLKAASDWDLKVIPNIGDQARVVIYRLLERQPLGTLKTTDEVRAKFERIWRARLGNDRFDLLLDEIVAMGDDGLDKTNLPAAQALWAMARRRRAMKNSP